MTMAMTAMCVFLLLEETQAPSALGTGAASLLYSLFPFRFHISSPILRCAGGVVSIDTVVLQAPGATRTSRSPVEEPLGAPGAFCAWQQTFKRRPRAGDRSAS
jgi:hypothetical protein